MAETPAGQLEAAIARAQAVKSAAATESQKIAAERETSATTAALQAALIPPKPAA